MPSFGHQKDSPGSVPRKIASLLTSDRFTDQPLTWASSVVRTRGMSPGVLQRVVCSVPTLEGLTLQTLNDPEVSNIGAGIKKLGYDAVWCATQAACFVSFTTACLRSDRLGPIHFASTGRATAETAAWIAERHIVDPCEAFALALWSEVGLAAAMYAFPDTYEAICAIEGDRSISSMEQEAFGFDHQMVGACVMRLYRFPQHYMDQCANHELDLLDLDLDEKLIRAASVATAGVGGWHFPKGSRPNLTAGVLAGALLRESDKESLEDFARSSLGNAMRSLSLQQKKSA